MYWMGKYQKDVGGVCEFRDDADVREFLDGESETRFLVVKCRK